MIFRFHLRIYVFKFQILNHLLVKRIIVFQHYQRLRVRNEKLSRTVFKSTVAESVHIEFSGFHVKLFFQTFAGGIDDVSFGDF